jgi:flagellar hook-basal body complex protein FliE
MIDALTSLGGLSSASRLDAFSKPAGTPGQVAGAETTFAAALNQTADRTVAKLEQAETLSVQALQGEVQTREVVDAVMSAEQSLQAAIAIRDKVVTAYLEISRMPI